MYVGTYLHSIYVFAWATMKRDTQQQQQWGHKEITTYIHTYF